ncbi:MAG: stage III sporulation protein AD [Oscillospiraceae bacterium]|nr:stage III sporulation protein AD [Oscillospiraceae bacterium]
MILTLTCGTWMVLMLAQTLGESVQILSRLAGVAKLDAHVVEPVIKVVGFSIVTRIGAEICRSAGEGGIAALVEIAGTLLSLTAAMPLVNRVLALITELLR